MLKAVYIFVCVFVCIQTKNIIDNSTDSKVYNRYEFIIAFKANYFKAIEYCHSRNMRLVSIHSEAEQKLLETYIKRGGFENERFWTSGSDLAEQGSWYWMSTGRPIIYKNFMPGEPNNHKHNTGTEHCVEYKSNSHQWNDLICTTNMYFICERREPANETCNLLIQL